MLLSRAMAAIGYFGGVSNIVQHALSDVFEDTAWLRSYCAENARRLGAAYAAISGAWLVIKLTCDPLTLSRLNHPGTGMKHQPPRVCGNFLTCFVALLASPFSELSLSHHIPHTPL